MKNLGFLLLFFAVSAGRASACDRSSLPDSLRDFIQDEQMYHDYRSRAGGQRWPSIFAPHRRKTFDILGCWYKVGTSQTEVTLFTSESELPIHQQMIRTNPITQEKEALFFFHPDADTIGHYQENQFLIQDSPNCSNYCATATSSNRTLLIWSETRSQFTPIFAKVSLDLRINSHHRFVDKTEIITSVQINEALRQSQQNLNFFHEVLGVLPNFTSTLGSAGMIIRTIPSELFRSRHHKIVPVFALFGDRSSWQKDIPLSQIQQEEAPYLLRAFWKKNLQELHQHLKEAFVEPLARKMLENAIFHGFTSEDHSQNLLVEVDQATSRLTGIFWHRDLDGFYLDDYFRKSIGLPVGPEEFSTEGQMDEKLTKNLEVNLCFPLKSTQFYVKEWVTHKLIVGDLSRFDSEFNLDQDYLVALNRQLRILTGQSISKYINRIDFFMQLEEIIRDLKRTSPKRLTR